MIELGDILYQVESNGEDINDLKNDVETLSLKVDKMLSKQDLLESLINSLNLKLDKK